MSTMLARADVRRVQPAPALELVGVPPPAVKARQLYDEARAASLEHLRALQDSLASLGGQLEIVVEGGDLYGSGLCQFAHKLAEDLAWKTKTLRMLTERQAGGRA
jgi:hypothetical protein